MRNAYSRRKVLSAVLSFLTVVALCLTSPSLVLADTLFGGQASTLFAGSGTESDPYLITSAEDWDALSNHVNNGGTDYEGKYFKLTADISVTTMLGYRTTGNVDIPFTGTFDGDGHTLNVAIKYNGPMAAPFGSVCNTVIKNLNVTGTVNGDRHSSGLVGGGNKGAITGSTLEVYNVTTSVAVNGYNGSAVSHLGGIVGHSLSARITMDNVVFTGSLNGSSAQGGFIGWGGGAGDKISICVLSNCLFAGTVRSGNTFHPVGYAYNNYGRATLTNFYTIKDKNNTSNQFDYQGTGYTVLSGLAAKVTDGGATHYYDSIASAVSSANWTANSTLTLLADVTTSSTITVPSGEHTLDLNGHTLTGSGVENVIRVGSGCTLTVCDSGTSGTITGGYTSSGYRYGAGVYVPGGHFILKSGTISGNRLTNGTTGGGGVEIESADAVFDMYGGTISNNQAGYGGGVYVRGGTFNFYDGLITGNKAHSTDGGGISVYGGSSTLNMYGGTITSNTANSGAGIGVSGGATVNISGGTISGNSATQSGGGITNRRTNASGDMNATIAISGNPVIKDNTTSGSGNNVYLYNNMKLTIRGALAETARIGVTLSNGTGTFTSGFSGNGTAANFVSDNSNYKVFLNRDGEAVIGIPPAASVIRGETTTDYSAISDAVSSTNWTAGSTLKLLGDVTISSTITVPEGEHTLDLNGHTLTGSGVENVIRVGSGCTLTVCDSGTSGTITGGYTSSGYRYGAGVYVPGGHFILKSGTISGNRLTNGTTGGGGVEIESADAVFDMYGGTISNNQAGYGGGVYVRGGTFNFYDGLITGNKAHSTDGGGISVYGGSSTLNMYGGTITSNTANSGAGIGVSGGATVNISGGTISGNSATQSGGGITNRRTNASGDMNATIAISGNPVIKDNTTSGSGNNVYLYNNMKLTIRGALAETARIGVTLSNGTGTFTSGFSGNGTAANFVADNSNYEVRLVKGEVYVGPAHTHDWSYSVSGGVITATCTGVAANTCDIADQTLTLTASGKTYDGTAVTATLTPSAGWTTANGLSTPAIVYSGNTDVGTYTASVTVGGKTASVSFTIQPKSMSGEVSASGYTGVYNGKAYGITVKAPTGATVTYGTKADDCTLTASPTFDGAGNHVVYYQVTRKNHVTVTGSATVAITPLNVTVTVTGHNATHAYDGTAHILAGYDATVDSTLYDLTKDYTFSGPASVSRTDAGTTKLGLTPGQFTNTNPNFGTVTFVVTDGSLTITPIDVTVTITGHIAAVDYDGNAHTVSGYDAVATSALYDVTKDFTFHGVASLNRTDVGQVSMGLTPSRFVNNNPNFKTVTFNVTDGFLTVRPVDAVITTRPVSATPTHTGSAQALLLAGKADGGTLYYALGKDDKTAPADKNYATALPTATDIGNYYVWYKVVSDANHNDLAPACVKVTLADKDWVTLTGTLYQSDGTTPLSNANVALIQGNRTVDNITTDDQGNYWFTVPTGVYNIVATTEARTATLIVSATANATRDLSLPGGKNESQLKVNTDSDDLFGIAVGGLDEEAVAIRQAENIADDKSVSVRMTVESKTETTAKNAKSIAAVGKNKNLTFFDITMEKSIDATVTVLDTTTNVMEIAVPYAYVTRRGVAVYYSDGGVQTFKESDSRENGTFRVDKLTGMVYIYANRFSTFAIGYTPYYHVESAMSFGSFEGAVTVILKNQDDGATYVLENVALDAIDFADVPKGQYEMTVIWEDGVTQTLTAILTIEGKAAASDGDNNARPSDTATTAALPTESKKRGGQQDDDQPERSL